MNETTNLNLTTLARHAATFSAMTTFNEQSARTLYTRAWALSRILTSFTLPTPMWEGARAEMRDFSVASARGRIARYNALDTMTARKYTYTNLFSEPSLHRKLNERRKRGIASVSFLHPLPVLTIEGWRGGKDRQHLMLTVATPTGDTVDIEVETRLLNILYR